MLELNISSPILEAFCGSGDVFTPSLPSRHSFIHDFYFRVMIFASINLLIV